MIMNCMRFVVVVLALGAITAVANANIFDDYESFAEGFLGPTVVHNGVTYHDANRVSGFFPDGIPFGPDELGSEYIIEQATFFYDEFPDYGSPDNSMTFGQAFIPGGKLDDRTSGLDLDGPGWGRKCGEPRYWILGKWSMGGNSIRSRSTPEWQCCGQRLVCHQRFGRSRQRGLCHYVNHGSRVRSVAALWLA